jgi:hypothetical protein
MTKPKKAPKRIFTASAILIIVSLAFGCSSPSQNQEPVATARPGQSQATKVPKGSKTALPTRTSVSTRTPTATASPAPETPGLSRRVPFAWAALASMPNWEVQVLQVLRGDPAWQALQATDQFTDEAPDGMEYVLVRLHVRNTTSDIDEHSLSACDLDVTGSRMVDYTCGMAASMEPALDVTLSSGEQGEGWATFLIDKTETNLILVINDPLNLDQNTPRFIALEQGASIAIPANLAKLSPTDLGTKRSTPATQVQTVTTRAWEVSVNNVVRGEDAWTMVQETNSLNDPPAKGMEYVAVALHVRSIGKLDLPAGMDNSYFSSTGSAKKVYEIPSLEQPDPALDVALFPGGEYEGWIVLQAAKGETGLLLVFDPSLGEDPAEIRYLALETK